MNLAINLHLVQRKRMRGDLFTLILDLKTWLLVTRTKFTLKFYKEPFDVLLLIAGVFKNVLKHTSQSAGSKSQCVTLVVRDVPQHNCIKNRQFYVSLYTE